MNFPNGADHMRNPIDSVLGAGKINVFNSYKIITESEKITDNIYNNYGWDSFSGEGKCIILQYFT